MRLTRCYSLAEHFKGVAGSIQRISRLFKTSVKNMDDLFDKYQFRADEGLRKVS